MVFLVNVSNWTTNFTFNASNMTLVQAWTNLSTPSSYLSPVLNWWTAALGVWFWFFLFFITVAVVYIKTDNVIPAAIVTLIFSVVMIQKLPPAATPFAYLFTVVAIFTIIFKIYIGRATR